MEKSHQLKKAPPQNCFTHQKNENCLFCENFVYKKKLKKKLKNSSDDDGNAVVVEITVKNDYSCEEGKQKENRRTMILGIIVCV